MSLFIVFFFVWGVGVCVCQNIVLFIVIGRFCWDLVVLVGDDGFDGFIVDDMVNVVVVIQIEDDDWQVVVVIEVDCCGVYDVKVVFEYLLIGYCWQ